MNFLAGGDISRENSAAQSQNNLIQAVKDKPPQTEKTEKVTGVLLGAVTITAISENIGNRGRIRWLL